ncbi:MAG TPA: SSI family serine proteinase inhibitor [Propionibacteriaceae bacterium]|nr:SSI family serine proteinase inhibitor [Propionibacteriaceae bacterium]
MKNRLATAQRLMALSFPILMLVAGCANQIDETSGRTSRTTTMPEAPPSSTPGEATSATPVGPEDTDLTIVVRDGSGKTSTWRLTCDPPGGTHPDPQAACRVLEANGAAALPPVPKDKACTQIYGGPETATITGTWQGKRVMSRFARNDGCQISRWKLMEGLLPRGGS